MEYKSKDVDVVIPKKIEPSHRTVTVDVPKDIVKDEPIDWTRIALAGGGGLLAHSIASSLLEKSEEEKRKESIWSKVLRTVLPIGAGVVGAYAGNEAGKGLGKIGAANEKPNVEPKEVETRPFQAKELKWDTGPRTSSKTVVPRDSAATAEDVLESWEGQPAAKFWDEMVPARSDERDTHEKLWYGGALASEIPAAYNVVQLIRKGVKIPSLRRAMSALQAAEGNAKTVAEQAAYLKENNPAFKKVPKKMTVGASELLGRINGNVNAANAEVAAKKKVVDDIAKKTKGMGWNAFLSLASQVPAGWSAYKGYQAGRDVDRIKALRDWYNSDEGQAVLNAYLQESNPDGE